MHKDCIILAGGLGTRLRGVVSDAPKCLAPINDKPFLHYLCKQLQQYHFLQGGLKITKIVLICAYKLQQLASIL